MAKTFVITFFLIISIFTNFTYSQELVKVKLPPQVENVFLTGEDIDDRLSFLPSHWNRPYEYVQRYGDYIPLVSMAQVNELLYICQRTIFFIDPWVFEYVKTYSISDVSKSIDRICKD